MRRMGNPETSFSNKLVYSLKEGKYHKGIVAFSEKPMFDQAFFPKAVTIFLHCIYPISRLSS
jgi:hypothetical protein